MAFGNKNSTPSFALTLPMKVTEQDEIFLSKKFCVGCTVYNQMVKKTTKMWHQLRKTRVAISLKKWHPLSGKRGMTSFMEREKPYTIKSWTIL